MAGNEVSAGGVAPGDGVTKHDDSPSDVANPGQPMTAVPTWHVFLHALTGTAGTSGGAGFLGWLGLRGRQCGRGESGKVVGALLNGL